MFPPTLKKKVLEKKKLRCYPPQISAHLSVNNKTLFVSSYVSNWDSWLQSQTFSLLQEHKTGLEAQDEEQQMFIFTLQVMIPVFLFQFFFLLECLFLLGHLFPFLPQTGLLLPPKHPEHSAADFSYKLIQIHPHTSSLISWDERDPMVVRPSLRWYSVTPVVSRLSSIKTRCGRSESSTTPWPATH